MNRTLIYAHRGANTEAAENTRTAFDKSLAYAIDGIETDVQLSRDEVAVLWHDRFLGKIGLPEKHIDDFDFAQLHGMDISKYRSMSDQRERIMTLQEFITSYRSRCRLLLEIKNRDWESLARHETKVRVTLELAGESKGEEVMISSFDLGSLIYAHRKAPYFPLIYNLEPEQRFSDAQRVLAEQPFLKGLCLPIATLDVGMAGLLRDHGKSLAVYTCNSDEEIAKAIRLGADILISDVPNKALEIRNLMIGQS